jgi:hypothetical protein
MWHLPDKHKPETRNAQGAHLRFIDLPIRVGLGARRWQGERILIRPVSY